MLAWLRTLGSPMHTWSTVITMVTINAQTYCSAVSNNTCAIVSAWCWNTRVWNSTTGVYIIYIQNVNNRIIFHLFDYIFRFRLYISCFSKKYTRSSKNTNLHVYQADYKMDFSDGLYQMHLPLEIQLYNKINKICDVYMLCSMYIDVNYIF